jgi:cellulose synthase/poly-beta-1,6-N-acetylglucosamine synthase-like glycosyltransferase
MHHRLREARVPYRIRFVPDPVCWTEVPESLRVLQRQRNRWQRGLIDTLRRHRKMIGRPRYGVVGLLALPSYVLFELLGPIVEVTGYLVIPLCAWLGIVNAPFMALFFALAVLCGVLLSVSGVLLEDMAFHRYPRLRDLVLLCVVGVIESFGYRQLNAWWRIRATWDYSRGRTGWGEMERKGFGPK